MLHVQIEILLPVQRKHFLHRRHRYPAARRFTATPVEQPVVSLFHVAFPPPPHVPVADAQDLCRLPPTDFLRHRLQDHILYFHCPLHRGLRVAFHALHGLLLSPPAKRTSHVLSQPDISCATDTGRVHQLDFGLGFRYSPRALGLRLECPGTSHRIMSGIHRIHFSTRGGSHP